MKNGLETLNECDDQIPSILFNNQLTRRMFDAKHQREAAIFRFTCRNKKKDHLNPQTLEQFNL